MLILLLQAGFVPVNLSVISDLAGVVALLGLVGQFFVRNYRLDRLETEVRDMKDSMEKQEKESQKAVERLRTDLLQEIRATDQKIDQRLGRIEDLLMRRAP